MKDMLVKLYELPEKCVEYDKLKKEIDFRRPLAAEKYLVSNWVKENFYKFDVIIHVVDIQSALNTEGENKILELITDCIKKEKDTNSKDIVSSKSESTDKTDETVENNDKTEPEKIKKKR